MLAQKQFCFSKEFHVFAILSENLVASILLFKIKQTNFRNQCVLRLSPSKRNRSRSEARKPNNFVRNSKKDSLTKKEIGQPLKKQREKLNSIKFTWLSGLCPRLLFRSVRLKLIKICSNCWTTILFYADENWKILKFGLVS